MVLAAVISDWDSMRGAAAHMTAVVGGDRSRRSGRKRALVRVVVFVRWYGATMLVP